MSVAIPGSIIDCAQSRELQAYLAGQIGRALTLFEVDEIVIYDDNMNTGDGKTNPSLYLARVLQYLETPQ